MSVFGCLADFGGRVDATDVDTDSFRKIMCYVYKEDITIRSLEEASNLLYAANKYKISSLDKLCEKFLIASVSNENVNELIAIAENYKLTGLLRVCKLFLSRPNPDIPASWMRFDPNQFSEGAVVAGYSPEGAPICIGRCIYEGNILPGCVNIVDQSITITHEGHAVKLKKYEILCNGNLYWSRSSLSHVLSDAVSGGTTELGEIVYIGRTMYEDALKIGKISPLSESMFISGPNGKEILVDGMQYEVLVEKVPITSC